MKIHNGWTELSVKTIDGNEEYLWQTRQGLYVFDAYLVFDDKISQWRVKRLAISVVFPWASATVPNGPACKWLEYDLYEWTYSNTAQKMLDSLDTMIYTFHVKMTDGAFKG